MESIKIYKELFKWEKDLGTVASKIKKDAVDDIKEIIEGYDEDYLIRWLDNNDFYCGDGIHQMNELDDVFCGLSVTEVLNELQDIDTSDEWFDEYNKVSSDDIWDLLDCKASDVARDIVYGEHTVKESSIEDIISMMNEAIEEVKKFARKYEIGIALMEHCYNEIGVDETIQALWNMNN